MIEKAIARITDEMMKIDDPLAQMLEEHLTEICTTDQVAERLLDPKKTLKKLHTKIWDVARDRKKGNGAYIPDEEIYKMAEDYYQISQPSQTPQKTTQIDVLDLL